MHESVQITKATPEQYYAAVTSPNIAEAIKDCNEGIAPSYQENSYLASFRSYSLIFTLAKMGEDVYETHIACPKDSIRASRLLVLGGMQWLYDRSKPKAIFTTCPEGKIANFVRKLGFNQVAVSGDNLVFLYAFSKINK